MRSEPSGSPVSTVLVDEAFANEDDRFVGLVRQVMSPKYLAGLADRWKKDPRPWARAQIFAYLALPLDRPGHHPLVKRLFKQAEENRDDELMAAFMVAFDRLVRRKRRLRFRYDYDTRQSWQEEELYAPRDQILASNTVRMIRDPLTGKKIERTIPFRMPLPGRLFSYRTRGYLRRRAARYFRRMGFQRPVDYSAAVAKGLAHYRDHDVATGENMLDNWSLMRAAFRRSPALVFKRTRVVVADGHSLGELSAAPEFGALWKKPESAAVLLGLVTQAQSRLVRVWAMQLLKRDHRGTIASITAAQLLALLDHDDDEVQQFGAGLLGSLADLDTWPITTWLQLLETRSVAALATICEAMARRVSPARLTFEQCVTLACARATPVARMGLAWLQERPAVSTQDRSALVGLASAQCEAVGVEVAGFALRSLGAEGSYRVEHVSPFFDSRNAEVRRGAFDWLTPASPGYDDPALWSRLLETPYDDVRSRLVSALGERTQQGREAGPPALAKQDLSRLWSRALLAVHRGGRAKLAALRQVSRAIAEHPDRAEPLVPVLAVAIRSVRPPEVRAGLAALLAALRVRPELEALLAKEIPELRLAPAEAAP